MTAAVANILDARVLVLNKNWYPVNVTKVLDAIHMVWTERALFIDPATCATYDFESWVESWDDAIKAAHDAVQAGGIHFRKPEVITCTNYGGMAWRQTKRRPKFSRANIYRRDKGICAYCGKKFPSEELTLEHVIPRAQGGETVWTNIVLACQSCNSRKKDRTPEQAGMRLLRRPFMPKAEDVAIKPHERIIRRIGRNAPKTWEQFLGKMYMEVELRQ